MEAWVKTHDKKLKPYQNSYDGYNIDCPIPTHQLKDQRLSIRPMKDGNVFLKCFGGCNYQDVRAAIAKEIKSPVVQAPTAPPLEALEQERAARQKAEDERDQERDARIDAENTAQELQDAKSSLENRLIAANARVSQVDTQLGVRIRVILLEERIKELAAGQGKSIQHEIRVRELQDEKTNIENRLTAAEEDARNLQRELDKKEKKADALQKDKSSLEKELGDAKTQHNEQIGELEPKALTFDFIADWGALEDKLEPIKKELWEKQRRPNPPSTFDQLRRAREKGYISEHQRLHLKNMIAQRNDIAHEGLPLPSDMARANLKFLKEVIGQL